MRNKFYLVGILILLSGVNAFAQLNLPRESQRAEIAQIVGDAKISVVYNRPNAKGRQIFGALVPFGQVWRTGANENTTFETSRDVRVNGQLLAAGKYGLHTIPDKNEWTIIFNRVNDAWGSFTYDEKKDALRVKAVPQISPVTQETMTIDFDAVTNNSAQAVISWANLRVPFTIDAGDVSGRILSQIRAAIQSRKPDDARPLNQGASYVQTFKLKDNYAEALGWLDSSIAVRETFANLSAKARLLAEMNRLKDAIAAGERAVQVGKSAAPPANTAEFEKTLAEWKTKK